MVKQDFPLNIQIKWSDGWKDAKKGLPQQSKGVAYEAGYKHFSKNPCPRNAVVAMNYWWNVRTVARTG